MVENILESKVQRQIIRYLEDAGWYVVKIIQTTKNGWPDLQVIEPRKGMWMGKTWLVVQSKMTFIEVKRPGTKPTPLQLVRHEELRARGFQVIVADSLESLKEQL